MARPAGSRDKQFESRRLALIALARAHLSRPSGRHASWRELAVACGVSTSTLAHYFGGREALVEAILHDARKQGDAYLAMAARPSGPFADSIRELVGMVAQGLDRGVMSLQVIGLTEGLGSSRSAHAFLGHHLEPMLSAIGQRLDVHVARGEMRPGTARFAAIGLLAPLVIARLHQSELGGAADYPLSLAQFDVEHAEAFIRAYQALPS